MPDLPLDMLGQMALPGRVLDQDHFADADDSAFTVAGSYFDAGVEIDDVLAAGRRVPVYVVLGLGARRRKKQPSAAQVLRWSAWWKTQHGLDTVFSWTPGRADDPVYPGDDELAAEVIARGPAK